MKIAYALRRFHPCTGVGRVLESTVPLLRERGHEVLLLCHRSSSPDGFPQISVPMLPWPSWARAASFDFFARRKANKISPDILHGQGDLACQDVLSVNNCDRAAARYVPGGRSPSPGNAYLRLRQFLPGASRRIVAVSRLLARDLEQFYGVDPRRMRVIYPGVDAQRFSPEPRAATRREWSLRWKLPQETFYFLSVLSGDPEKRNLDNLLSAFQSLHHPRPHQLLLAGPASLLRRFHKLSGLLQGGRLRFIPLTPRLEDTFAGADLYLLCAHYEEFGLPVLEAMAAGCPAMVGTRCGVREFLRPGENGLLLENPGSPEEIRTLLLKALETDEGTYAAMRREARRTALQAPWSRTVQETLQLYQEVLNEKL